MQKSGCSPWVEHLEKGGAKLENWNSPPINGDALVGGRRGTVKKHLSSTKQRKKLAHMGNHTFEQDRLLNVQGGAKGQIRVAMEWF